MRHTAADRALLHVSQVVEVPLKIFQTAAILEVRCAGAACGWHLMNVHHIAVHFRSLLSATGVPLLIRVRDGSSRHHRWVDTHVCGSHANMYMHTMFSHCTAGKRN